MIGKSMRIAAAIVLAALIGLSAQGGRYDYELPEYQQFTDRDLPVLAVSRDGKQFAYCTTQGIYLCSGTPPTARLLAGTKGVTALPFFSPDGRWLGYWSYSEGILKKIPIEGGDPVPLRSAYGQISGAHWVDDDTIIYSRLSGSIVQMSATGKKSKSLLDTEFGTVFPQVLPDGKSLLYSHSPLGNFTDAKIIVMSLKTGERKTICAGFGAWYLPGGHLVYRSPDNAVFAAPFNLGSLEITGAPVPMLKDVYGKGMSMQYAVSESGALVYIPDGARATSAGQVRLAWVSREGKEEPIPVPPNPYAYARLSPDGTRLALTLKADTGGSIWVWDFGRKSMTRLTSEPDASGPIWSENGTSIFYHASPDNANYDVLRKGTDGAGEAEKLASVPKRPYAFVWSKTDQKLTLLPITVETDYPPQLSPDGKWVAYWSSESGRNEVYVRPFPQTTNGQWLISSGGGTYPLWSPDGRELYYRYEESVMATPVETEPAFKSGKPYPLFWRPDVPTSDNASFSRIWDISPDGKRFLMMAPVQSQHRITVVANWLELIR